MICYICMSHVATLTPTTCTLDHNFLFYLLQRFLNTIFLNFVTPNSKKFFNASSTILDLFAGGSPIASNIFSLPSSSTTISLGCATSSLPWLLVETSCEGMLMNWVVNRNCGWNCIHLLYIGQTLHFDVVKCRWWYDGVHSWIHLVSKHIWLNMDISKPRWVWSSKICYILNVILVNLLSIGYNSLNNKFTLDIFPSDW